MAWISTAAAAATFIFVATGSAAELPSKADDADYNVPDNNIADADSHWLLDEHSQCWAFDANGGPHNSVLWSGRCLDGRATGPGTLTFLDNGRMFEKLTGKFDSGMVQDGHVAIVWSDGSHYDGDVLRGQFNGRGVLVAADGTRQDGMWKNNKLVPTEATRSSATTPQPAPKSADPVANRWTMLAGSSATLIAADGSKLSLAVEQSGKLARETLHPDGAILRTSMMLLSDRLGTLSSDKGDVVAIFHLSGQTLNIEYADGRTEILTPNSDGGLSITVQTPGAAPNSTNWYPQGHVFAPETATIQDAPVPADPATKSTPAPAAADPDKSATKQAAHLASKKHSSRHARSHTLNVSSVTPAPPTEPIVVRTSEVHMIDAPTPEGSASDCLSVESNGTHWGFRNNCVTDIQFAYCMKNGSDRMTACGESAVPGSVGGHGFSALMADFSLADKNADHAFRWVGCAGGAGEVVPRLDQTDPPMGRCLHASDLPPAGMHADESKRASR